MEKEEKVIVENDDGDTAEINLKSKGNDSPEEQAEDIPKETSNEEVEKLKAELSAKNDRLIRLQADFENFRRRTAKEKTELAATVEQAFLKDLLPLLDNLSRATSAVESSDETSLENLRKGIEMIKEETIAALGKHGLEPIETEGKQFDPNFHQAVGRVADPEKEDGTIALELQKGYIAKGRVIRPSMVHVVSND